MVKKKSSLITSSQFCGLMGCICLCIKAVPSPCHEIKNVKGDTIEIDPNKTSRENVFEILGLTRYCCRRHLLTHVDLIEII